VTSDARPAALAAAPADGAGFLAAVQRRTVAVLSGAQVLGGVGVGAGVAVGGLIAASLANSDSAAGLAQTASTLGAAVAAVPLSRLMNRRGRRRGLAAGLMVGALGAAVVLVASVARSLPLLLVGTFLFGTASATGLQARYAATDLAEPRHRARALSLVVWATTIGAVAGPNLADPAGRVALELGLPMLAGPYLFSLAAFALGALLVATLLRPDPLLLARRRFVADGGVATPALSVRAAYRIVGQSPRALLGLGAIVVAHTAMVGVMVMTPIHLRHVDVSLTVIGLVISVHIAGMYALSPVVGWAVDRFGRVPMIYLGAVLLLASAAVAGTAPAHDSAQLGVGLFLLGLGWSCGLVAGSTLLTESVPAATRTSVQGAADLAMNAAGAVGGALAGVVVALASYGWLTVGAAGLVGLLVIGAAHPACRLDSNTRST
jgi:MFS family permease